jgi:hypothetical protein
MHSTTVLELSASLLQGHWASVMQQVAAGEPLRRQLHTLHALFQMWQVLQCAPACSCRTWAHGLNL